MEYNGERSLIPRLNGTYKHISKRGNQTEVNSNGTYKRRHTTMINGERDFNQKRISPIDVLNNSGLSDEKDKRNKIKKYEHSEEHNTSHNMNEIDYRPLRRRRTTTTLLGLNGETAKFGFNTNLPSFQNGSSSSGSRQFRKAPVSYNDPAFLQQVTDRDKKVLHDLGSTKKAIAQVEKNIDTLSQDTIPNFKYEINKKETLIQKLTKDLARIEELVAQSSISNQELNEQHDLKVKNLKLEQEILLQNEENKFFEDKQAHEAALRTDFEAFRDLKQQELKSLKFQDNKEVNDLRGEIEDLEKQLKEKNKQHQENLRSIEDGYLDEIRILQETQAAEIFKLEKHQETECLARLESVSDKIAQVRKSIETVKQPLLEDLKFKVSQLEANLHVLNTNKDLNVRLMKFKQDEYEPRTRQRESLNQLMETTLDTKHCQLEKLNKEIENNQKLQTCIDEFKSSRKSL